MDTFKETELKDAEVSAKQDARDLKVLKYKLDTILKTSPNASIFSQFIKNALFASFEFDLGFDHAFTVLGIECGETIELEKMAWVDKMRSKFSELIFLDRMIH